jgi:hypothetical protein
VVGRDDQGVRGGWHKKANNWSSLFNCVEKSDISEHYGDSTMPMQLRMLTEKIYGRPLMGQSGSAMLQFMKSSEGEDGGDMVYSMLGISSL